MMGREKGHRIGAYRIEPKSARDARRIECGATYDQLAAAAGVSLRTVVNVLHRRVRPTITTKRKIDLALLTIANSASRRGGGRRS